MLSFLRRFSALTKKNLLIISRSPISTSIRALIIPLLIVLILSFSKNFFSSDPGQNGIGNPTPIISLSDALSQAGARDTVVLCDNGLKGGDISRVIESVSATIKQAGLTTITTSNASDIGTTCNSTPFKHSKCFAAIRFYSSLTEGPGQVWNYTLSADAALESVTNVYKTNNDAQIFAMPLQRAIDSEIVTLSGESLPSSAEQIPYTYSTVNEQEQEETTTAAFLGDIAFFLGALFFLALIPVVYHMTGFIAAERELGMSALLDASGVSLYSPQLLRLSSTYAAFVAVYGLSWLLCGIIMATVVFTRTNAAITIFYHLLNGLALCSFSLLGSVYFAKARLSGIWLVVVAVVLALLPQLLAGSLQKPPVMLALSLLFPSSNYTYWIVKIAQQEQTELVGSPPDGTTGNSKFLSLGTLFGFLAFQILVYPILAVFLERFRFGTSSKGYKRVTAVDDVSVNLVDFSKTYKENPLKRMFRRKNKDNYAVKSLNLSAKSGTITMLLGPNGCGKSTTLNAIAGLSKVSDGTIEIDRSGGFGFAPQRNVLWEQLTVEEHVRIFMAFKSGGRTDEAEVQALIRECDLEGKGKARAKTLSGGQKRKLHLAIMFAGGSRVCCVDEVSTGVDPLSRRKIWDILLAKRQGVCIIMTTHFLDEADWLADDIIIMAKGEERAHGSSAELKHRLGNGYSVHVPLASSNFVVPSNIEVIERIESEGLTDYRVATSAQAATLINVLETRGISGFTVTGPTIEELFLKMTKDDTPILKKKKGKSQSAVEEENDTEKEMLATTLELPEGQHLLDGKEVSIWKQSWFLFRKRCTIFRRNWGPYLAALAIALIGSGVTPAIFKQYQRLPCPQDQDLNGFYEYGVGADLSAYGYATMIMGPRSKLSNVTLRRAVNLYDDSHTYDDYSGVNTLTDFLSEIHFVESESEFHNYLSENQARVYPGGVFLSDPPLIAWEDSVASTVILQNLVNIFSTSVPIATSYQSFYQTQPPQLIDFNTLIFVVLYGLVMSCYPAFFALYPTAERLQGVRSMQYSNGVRPAALWLAYWSFDTMLVILISAISTVLLAVATKVWFNLAGVFAVLLFYGIASAMYSYIISMFAPSPLAAWSLSAASQIILYFAVFAGYIGIQAKVDLPQLAQYINYMQWTVGLISPGANLQRALYVSLGLYNITCGSTTAWTLYAGPIVYLIIQCFIFLLILLAWDNGGVPLRSIIHRRRRSKVVESSESAINLSDTKANSYALTELGRVDSVTSGINIINATKIFGNNKAVEDVTLAVPRGETFALLGPNGAGKSTIISLIRGDIRPSTTSTSISIDNTSILIHRTTARSKLGVCPQFDAIDSLTVRESLTFFARIRGVSDPSHNVTGVITACGLAPWADKLARTLSGGTKRKLSLAQALVGNPKVLLLDEPSSSLDATSKRVLWRTLAALSKDRAVLFTTHSMEEAQVLADRVGILSSRMLATGTVEEMCHDDIFHVHLVAATAPHTTSHELDAMMAWIRRSIPGASMDRETYCGQIRFSVTAAEGFPRQGGPEGPGTGGPGTGMWMSIGKLFSLLERGKEELGVACYSVGRTTLDDVFVRIVREYGGKEEDGFAGGGGRAGGRKWWKW